MSTTDETKPAAKSKRRKGKSERSKKAVSQATSPETQPQPVLAESPKVAPRPAVEEAIVAAAAVPEPQPAVAPSPSKPVKAAPSSAKSKSAAPKPVEPKSVESKSVESKPFESRPSEPTLVEPKPAEPKSAETVSAEPPPAAPAPVEPAPVSLQTIANAYRDYTRKSIQDFGSFVEQLSGVRSLDKAMTVQTEFVKRAYETSVAESQKICELHNRLAKQTLDPFKTLAGKTPAPQGKR